MDLDSNVYIIHDDADMDIEQSYNNGNIVLPMQSNLITDANSGNATAGHSINSDNRTEHDHTSFDVTTVFNFSNAPSTSRQDTQPTLPNSLILSNNETFTNFQILRTYPSSSNSNQNNVIQGNQYSANSSSVNEFVAQTTSNNLNVIPNNGNINIPRADDGNPFLQQEVDNLNVLAEVAETSSTLPVLNTAQVEIGLSNETSDIGIVSPSLISRDFVADKVSAVAKKRKIENEDSDDDGKMCPICLDHWTNVGDHRVCALKCGHLFGYSCITRWFSTQKKKNCPTCKKKAANSDIRYIYAKRLIAMDATQLEEVKEKLNEAREEKNKIQVELLKSICKDHLNTQKIAELERQIETLETKLSLMQRTANKNKPVSKETIKSEKISVYMDKSLEICKEGGCRVLDYCASHNLVVASMKSPNTLFRGFGVRKIDIETYKPTAFIPLHASHIRDIRFHPENPWLLSVSLDKTIKLVDAHTTMPIFVYVSGTVPLWSCCWDVNNTNLFYVGKQHGSIDKFDIRRMTEPICTLEVPVDMSPVVSVASLAASADEGVAFGGVISCKLNSLWLFAKSGEDYIRHPLPIEGPFTSMQYYHNSRQLFVSTRPNNKHPISRHHLCKIQSGPSNNIVFNVNCCLPGSGRQTKLSRSCLVSNQSHCYAAAYQEAHKSVFLWNVNTGGHIASVPARDPVLDLTGVTVNTASSDILLSLGERKLEFFKFA